MTEPREETSPYRTLPEPVAYDDMVTSQDTDPVPDPQADRDTERDFMLRYAG